MNSTRKGLVKYQEKSGGATATFGIISEIHRLGVTPLRVEARFATAQHSSPHIPSNKATRYPQHQLLERENSDWEPLHLSLTTAERRKRRGAVVQLAAFLV